MVETTGVTRCNNCRREESAYKCGGCSQMFCFTHLAAHRETLRNELDEVEANRNTFHQTFIKQTADPPKHQLIDQIDQWEIESIKKIQQTAEEARQLIRKQINRGNTRLELKLNTLTDQLRITRQEDIYNEIELRQFREALTRLTIELNKPPTISIQEEPTPLITKIHVEISAPLRSTNININANWTQNGVVVAGDNGSTRRYSPYGIFVDDDQTIYVADRANDRIIEWKCGANNGQVVAGGNRKGNGSDQLNQPTDVIVNKDNDSLIICDLANRRVMQWSRQNTKSGQIILSNIDCCGLTMDNEGYLYISDCEKHEVKRWRIGDTNGIVVAGGNEQGSRLDQLNNPTYIFVDDDHSVYVSDTNNHRVMKWLKGAKQGIVVAGNQGQGNDLTQLSCPHGVIVDQMGTVYVADSFNQRVMRWSKEATRGSIVIGGDQQENGNHLGDPIGLSFDRLGNLYAADFDNHQIQRFDINLSLIS